MHEHRNRHRSDAAGNRCDRARNRLYLCEIDIAAQLSVLLSVNADIDHDRTLFDIVCRDHFRSADRDNQNIRLSAYVRQIIRLLVADCNRRILTQH